MIPRNDHLVPRDHPLAAGEIAPDFVLADQDRREWRLADALRQGDVVLCFFPMAFTSVCGTENRCITAEMGAWQARGAQVVGISCDSFAVLKAWAQAEGLRHTLLADMHRQVCRAYGFYWPELNVASRGTVVIGRADDGRGRVRWVQVRQPKNAMNFEDVLAHVG